MPAKKIIPIKTIHGVYLGCDPEFFFTKNGKVIGAEKIITSKKGIDASPDYYTKKETKIIIDGVQAEINTKASTCRAILSSELQRCFQKLKEITSKEKGLKVVTSTTVDIEPAEMESLTDDSKRFGCSPSTNIDKRIKSDIYKINPAEYFKRSAGGHIHLGKIEGTSTTARQINRALNDPKRTIKMLDIIVGNTCVMIDRDPGNIERRKFYGKAGEYRKPGHGLEYRTLSNFWLQSYELMSFVFGLSRLAVNIVAQSTPQNNYEKEILKAVSMKDIRNAINNNDAKLAFENYQKVAQVLSTIIATNTQGYEKPFNKINQQKFLFFVKKGLGHWFENDAIKNWTTKKKYGWENFLSVTVTRELNKETAEMDKKLKTADGRRRIRRITKNDENSI